MVLITASIWAQKKAPEKKKTDEKQINGFIFNTTNILFDIESYLGGIGFKMKNVDLKFAVCDLRLLGDFLLVKDFNMFEINLGATLEFHFLKNRVSPYWGVFLNSGLTRYRTETDSDNWSELLTIPVSTGGILGVEFFLLDSLSFFAEYAVEINLSNNFNNISVGGTLTETTTTDFYIDTKLGNSSRLGIVIYFDPVVKVK
jgi:hypothetical protein